MKTSAPDLRPIIAMLRKACAGQMTEADSTAAMGLCVPFGNIISFALLCRALADEPMIDLGDGPKPVGGWEQRQATDAEGRLRRNEGAPVMVDVGPRGVHAACQEMARGMALQAADALECGDLLKAMGALLAAAMTMAEVSPKALAWWHTRSQDAVGKDAGFQSYYSTKDPKTGEEKRYVLSSELRQQAEATGCRQGAREVLLKDLGKVAADNIAKSLQEKHGWKRTRRK